MRTSTSFLAVVALSTGLVAGGTLLAPAIAQNADAGQATASTSKRLTIGEVHDKLIAQGYRDIDEIEREDRGFEVKAVDAEGRRVKLEVDAVTGEVLGTRTKSDKRDRAMQ
ncbi:MAG TPA: PepSY domain-containing protein [Burkholderiales bacterium]|nr:PepSY domain-containing protein [Burkholderiales bacterium]